MWASAVSKNNHVATAAFGRPSVGEAPRTNRHADLRALNPCNIPAVGWTIFTAIDLYIGVVLIDLISTTSPPEKILRLRKARKIALVLLGISVVILAVQIARRYGWM
jgi:hypothetical protein